MEVVEVISPNTSVKISVIMPVYNMKEYLPATIDSWLAQTMAEIELICIDDCSTDGSYEYLVARSTADNRLIISRFERNQSAWMARKRGIELARGDYIMFADADDEILPCACEELYHEMISKPVDILHFNASIVNVNHLPQQRIRMNERLVCPYNGAFYGQEVFSACFRDKKYTFSLWNKMFSASLCKKAMRTAPDGIFPKAQDKLAYFIFSFFAESYRGIPEKKYYRYYLGRGGTGLNVLNEKQFERYCTQAKVADAMNDFMVAQNKLKENLDIIETNRKQLLNECIMRWIENVTDADKAACYSLLCKYWKPSEVVGALAEKQWYKRDIVSRWLQGASALACTKNQVRTVATYYYTCYNGGLQRVMCQLCELWAQMGYQVILITEGDPTEKDYPLPANIKRFCIDDHLRVNQHNYINRALQLEKILIENNVDAFVYHAWVHNSMLWDEIICKSLGIAFIPHCHSIFSLGIRNNFPNVQNMIAPYRLADAIVTLSDADRCFWQHFNNNVHDTLNPFSESLDAWQPDMNRHNHDIVWVGRLSGEKRPYDTLQIMKRVLQEIPDAVLHIVGSSPKGDFEAGLQKKILSMGLEGHVILEGFHLDVKPFYLSASLALMTSTYEGYSLTLQECKLAGLPCVLYEMPYLTLCRGNRGIVPVVQGDISAAANAIIDLFTHEDKRIKMAKESREHIDELSQYDFQSKWANIFNSLFQEHVEKTSEDMRIMMDTLIKHHDVSTGARKGLSNGEKTSTGHIVKVAIWAEKFITSLHERGLRATIVRVTGFLNRKGIVH